MAKKIIIGAIIIVALAAAFFYGGSPPQSAPTVALETAEGSPSQPPTLTAQPEVSDAAVHSYAPSSDNAVPSASPMPNSTQVLAPPDPVETQDTEVKQVQLFCSISIQCSSIINNIDLLPAEKQELLPENGWILSCAQAEYYEGESVFNVLQRTVKQYGIHMEYVNTPVYNSAYIEGIANIYEFDCGALSGWMYKVNGLFPNYGCSSYQIQPGDEIELIYTCDLGKDIGGGGSAEGQFIKD